MIILYVFTRDYVVSNLSSQHKLFSVKRKITFFYYAALSILRQFTVTTIKLMHLADAFIQSDLHKAINQIFVKDHVC